MMWSLNAVADEEHMSNSISRSRSRNDRASSSTFSTSSSSSLSPYRNPRTMEEVWKDINLSSSPMFQDFLAGPFERDPHALNATASPPPPLPLPPPPQLPATMLTLTSGAEFNLFGSLNPSSRQSPGMFFPSRSVDGVVMNQNTNKRGAAAALDTNDCGSGDRRYKRMIKNRESAARSRAYTTELELEVDQLTKENAKLREQQRQLCQAAAAVDRRSKHRLHRTSTAPF